MVDGGWWMVMSEMFRKGGIIMWGTIIGANDTITALKRLTTVGMDRRKVT